MIVARSTSILLLLAVGIPNSSLPATTAESTEHHFHIQSQPLGDALQEFARQGGVQVIFFSRLVEGHTAPSVHGRFTVIAALDLLLADSRLTYVSVGSQTFQIRERGVQ